MQKTFLSCDWGTSSFRLRLIDIETLQLLAETNSNEGVTTVYELWQQTQDKERIPFYTLILHNHIIKLEQQLNRSLNDVIIIMSGMISSTIGMIELPYKELPFSSDGSDLHIHKLDKTNSFHHDIIIISGARTLNDVMRGEETQLAGSLIEQADEKQLFIFPGTHSKHIITKSGKATTFNTYMTGEFFELLSKKSILSNSVYKSNIDKEGNIASFKEGVKDSLHQNLLHSSFVVRTNLLFKRFSKEENYFYLSGLLIGTELNQLSQEAMVSITIVSDEILARIYSLAFEALEMNKRIKTINIDEAMVRGHKLIYQYYLGIEYARITN